MNQNKSQNTKNDQKNAIVDVDLYNRTAKSLTILLELNHKLLANAYNTNIASLYKASKMTKFTYNQVYNILSTRSAHPNGPPNPRIRNRPLDNTLGRIVYTEWLKCVDEQDFFPDFGTFRIKVEETCKKTGVYCALHLIERCLNEMNVFINKSSNVCNVDNPVLNAKRVERCQTFLNAMKELKIGEDGDDELYFYDEANVNQLHIEKFESLSPFGIKAFRKHHNSITTESVTLQLIVNSKKEIVYYRTLLVKTDGTTDYRKVIDFLEEFLTKIETKGKSVVYLDNAGCHTRAINGNLSKGTKKQIELGKPYIKPQEDLKKKLFFIWAPSCTPESNLAEYCFRSFKAYLKSCLLGSRITRTGVQWKKFVDDELEKWKGHTKLQGDILTHITTFTQRLIDAGGDLQVEAVLAKGYVDMEDFEDSIRRHME